MVPASVSLAWLSAQPNIGGPVASATNDSQLNEILYSTTIKLDNDDLKLLDHVSK